MLLVIEGMEVRFRKCMMMSGGKKAFWEGGQGSEGLQYFGRCSGILEHVIFKFHLFGNMQMRFLFVCSRGLRKVWGNYDEL